MLFVLLVVLLCAATLVSSKSDIFQLVAREEISEIEELLDRQPQLLNKQGPGGQTPLMNAVLSGKTNVVKLLLSRNADVSIGEQDGYTPMVRESSLLYLHATLYHSVNLNNLKTILGVQ